MTKKTDANYGRGEVTIDADVDTLEPTLKEIRVGVKESISKENFEIPLLPHIATRVLQMANDPKAGITEIENLVKQDQVIAAKIIKMANSPYYRGLTNIVSLRDAMGRIGLKALKDIVFSLGVQSKVFKVKGYEPVMDQVWKHSIACAAIAQFLAKKLNADSEHAFLAGLLHDIGKPVLIQVVAQYETKQKQTKIDALKKAFKPIDEKLLHIPGIHDVLLPHIFNKYHAVVGALVATKWQLPPAIVEVIRHHHDFTQAKENKVMTIVVHAANLLCHHFGYGHEETPYILHQQKAFMELKVSQDVLKVWEDEIPKAAESLMESL